MNTTIQLNSDLENTENDEATEVNAYYDIPRKIPSELGLFLWCAFTESS